MSRRRIDRLYLVYLGIHENDKHSVYAKDLESLKETLAKKFRWEKCVWHRKETPSGYPEGAMHFEIENPSAWFFSSRRFPLLIIPD